MLSKIWGEIVSIDVGAPLSRMRCWVRLDIRLWVPWPWFCNSGWGFGQPSESNIAWVGKFKYWYMLHSMESQIHCFDARGGDRNFWLFSIPCSLAFLSLITPMNLLGSRFLFRHSHFENLIGVGGCHNFKKAYPGLFFLDQRCWWKGWSWNYFRGVEGWPGMHSQEAAGSHQDKWVGSPWQVVSGWGDEISEHGWGRWPSEFRLICVVDTSEWAEWNP